MFEPIGLNLYFQYADGILSIAGQLLFQKIFKIEKKTAKGSLAFIIDNTGSMANDIQNVKEEMIRIIAGLNRNSLPENFILVTFNDPGLYT